MFYGWRNLFLGGLFKNQYPIGGLKQKPFVFVEEGLKASRTLGWTHSPCLPGSDFRKPKGRSRPALDQAF